MTARHRTGNGTDRRAHFRLALIVLAPLLVLVPASAWATTHTGAAAKHAALRAPAAAGAGANWSYTWNPPLDLRVHGSTAGFMSLPNNMASLATQKVVSTATFRTNWIDTRALSDGPNIAQQGLSVKPPQFKLQIAHGPNPTDHRGDCHIDGATGQTLAYGPRIDVADGKWHTITCIKYPDTAQGTQVVVIVDGVAGTPHWSHTPIGNINPAGAVRLGGRSAKAATDSLDGWLSFLSFQAT